MRCQSRDRAEVKAAHSAETARFSKTDFAYISSEMKCRSFSAQNVMSSARVSGGWVYWVSCCS